MTVSRGFDVSPSYGIDACGVTIRYICAAATSDDGNELGGMPCFPQLGPHETHHAKRIGTYSLRPGDVVDEDAAGIVAVTHATQPPTRTRFRPTSK